MNAMNMILTAPEQKTFPTVDQGTYVGKVESIDVQDWTTKPDPFGKKGHYTLVFKWLLAGQTDENDNPITLPQYVRFATGDKPMAKGARAGRLPWLTEITRALCLEDLQPGDAFDPETLVGKRAKLGVLLTEQTDGTLKNSINSVSKADPRKPKTAPKAPPPPADDEDDDPDNIPF